MQIFEINQYPKTINISTMCFNLYRHSNKNTTRSKYTSNEPRRMHRSAIRIRYQRRTQWENRHPWLDTEALDLLAKHTILTWDMCNFIKNRHWFEHHPTVSTFIRKPNRHQLWSAFVQDVKPICKDNTFPWQGILFG